MHEPRFDSLARQASAISRRGSLAILGGTALAALATPAVTSAGKGK